MTYQHQHSENHETILLAEDEPELRKLLGMILRLAGYNVLTASNGKEALQLFSTRQDDIRLVVTDLLMPVMGGMEAALEIQKIVPDVRVLFCSGFINESTKPVIKKNDAFELLKKPFHPQNLLATVRKMLDR